MQATETDERAFAAIVVSDAVSAVGVGDVDLNDDQIGGVVDGERLDVFVDDEGVVIRREICGEGSEPERREEGVLDGTPIRACCFCEGRENEFDFEWTRAGSNHRALPLMRARCDVG